MVQINTKNKNAQKNSNETEDSATETKQGKDPYSEIVMPKAGVALLDIDTKLNLPNTEQILSHMDQVKGVIGRDNPNTEIKEIYRIQKGFFSTKVDLKKINRALSKVLETHKDTNVKVVNISSATYFSCDKLNWLVPRFAPKQSKELTITTSNLLENAELIKEMLVDFSSKYPKEKTGDIVEILKQVSLVEELNSEGVAVIVAAGNKGPDEFNLLPVLAPDTIAVGGLDGKNPHKESANNPTIDTWSSYHNSFDLNNTKIECSGTSFSCANLVDDVLELLSKGHSVKEVNQILRQDSSLESKK